ncbi:Techylectin-5B [Holothuria leucospilota]|uniref:Techylectin-5B n=1 Tax=Holothuria leucospilota TaxID=206669 RepID=A0A9Q1BVL6_HOLLE|nr:Techylectin-5B [Holothuria leucospilota]
MWKTTGSSFSTYDSDNDKCEFHNCAEGHRSAWWFGTAWCIPCLKNGPYCDMFPVNSSCYNTCSISNPNGMYGGEHGRSISWFRSSACNMLSSVMKIRPTTHIPE